jgi:hypothetical protein
MTNFARIKADVKTFFADLSTSAGKFAAAFVKIFSKAPSAIQMIANFVGEAAPVVTAAVALADPLIEPEVAAALATVETGLAAIEASAQAAVSGTSLVSALQAFATTVPALLSGLAIKDSGLQAAITRIVTLVTGEAAVLIPAAESWVKQIAAMASAAPAAS